MLRKLVIVGASAVVLAGVGVGAYLASRPSLSRAQAPSSTRRVQVTSTTRPNVTTTTTSTTTTTTTATTPPSLPIATFGMNGNIVWSGRDPTSIYISGDATNIVTGITWSSWDSTEAVGQGTSDILGCVPDCAQGSATPVATTIVLSEPVQGRFTLLTETRQGSTTTYPLPGKVGGAS
ncbi:MAG: hypothetical protein ACRD0Z_13195 [Acidimicrobiales bacterium]